MRRLLLLLLLLSFESASFAAIQVQSFYFKQNSTELTTSSRQQLQVFVSTLNEDASIEIIELSCYAEGSTPDSNKRLSDLRMLSIIDLLGLKNKPVTINSWGSKRLNVKFTPLNWDRIDIYCRVDGLPDSLDYEKKKVPSIVKSESRSRKPLILNILFEGGTSVMIEETIPSLERLYDTLRTNPHLTAHIRGHVCCENNKRLSRIRAKEIHDHLVNKGISKDRLSYKGYGNKLPLVFPERNAEDRAQNRRVDVVFSMKKEH